MCSGPSISASNPANVGLVDNGRVFIEASDNDGEDHLIQSVDAKTGQEQWRQDVDPGEFTSAAGRLLYWSSDSKDKVDVIDPAKGESLKRFRYDRITEQRGRLVAVDNNKLRQFSLGTLEEIGEPIQWDADYSDPLLATDGVYVINNGDELIRLDHSGKRAWRASTSDDSLYAISDLGNGLIAVSGSDGIAVGRESGQDFKEVWNSSGSISDVFRIGDRVVVAVYDDPDLNFVEAKTGKELTSVEVAASDSTNIWPMSNGAIVRLNDDSSEFAGLSLPSGTELWRFSEDFASVVPFDGGVLVITPNEQDITFARRN